MTKAEIENEKLIREEARRFLDDPAYLAATLFYNNPEGTKNAFFGVGGIEDVGTPEAALELLPQMLKEDAGTVAKIFEAIEWIPENGTELQMKAIQSLYQYGS